jgi:hypothetical protein
MTMVLRSSQKSNRKPSAWRNCHTNTIRKVPRFAHNTIHTRSTDNHALQSHTHTHSASSRMLRGHHAAVCQYNTRSNYSPVYLIVWGSLRAVLQYIVSCRVNSCYASTYLGHQSISYPSRSTVLIWVRHVLVVQLVHVGLLMVPLPRTNTHTLINAIKVWWKQSMLKLKCGMCSGRILFHYRNCDDVSYCHGLIHARLTLMRLWLVSAQVRITVVCGFMVYIYFCLFSLSQFFIFAHFVLSILAIITWRKLTQSAGKDNSLGAEGVPDKDQEHSHLRHCAHLPPSWKHGAHSLDLFLAAGTWKTSVTEQ